MGGHGTVEDENLSTDDLSKPLFSWILPFVQGQLPQEESFSEFVASNVLQQVLNSLGIAQTPVDPSSSLLSLSGTWDEDLGIGGSSMVTTRPNHDGETRERIQKLSGNVQLVVSHYMDELNILSVTSPPNVVHIATFCKGCAVLEMEKLLRLMLGAAVGGNQKQETMRKIKEFSSKVQEQLILEIKQLKVADVADLVELKSWVQFHALPQEKQETNYGNPLSQCQLLVRERNSLLKIIVTEAFVGGRRCGKGMFIGLNAPNWVLTCYRSLVDFIFGMAATQLVTDIGKYSIGRLRPNFISVCGPDIDFSNCAQYNHTYLQTYKCLNSENDAAKSRVSFPSGHSSFSAYTMLYCAIFIQAKWKVPESGVLRILKHAVQTVLILLAYFTAVSRVMDNKHHWSDVTAGALIGAIIASLTAKYVAKLNSRRPGPRTCSRDEPFDGLTINDEESGSRTRTPKDETVSRPT